MATPAAQTEVSETSYTAAEPPLELNLVTLNCWGLLHISALRTLRLAYIGTALAAMTPAPDIVCLQECWTQDDYSAIRAAVSAVLPYGKFYHNGAFGAGLAILTRWPIRASSMSGYPLNGRPTAFWRGDWFVGKGVACATVRFGPPGREHTVEVFNTHTHAPYEKEPNDSYICHRTAQAWHMASLLRAASDRGSLVVALGDFNMLPDSLAHRLITAQAPVRDVWRVLYPDSSLGPVDHPPETARGRPVPSAEYNLSVNGATSDGVYNTWRWSKVHQRRLRSGQPCVVDPDTPDPKGKRLDYIFASTGNASSSSSTSGWVVKSASVALTQRHPTLHVSLSDHFAVQATLELHNPSLPSATTTISPANANYNTQLDIKGNSNLPSSVYDEILAMIHTYKAREVKQRYWRGVHFYVALLTWVACLIAVWFSPRPFVTFILMLFGSLNLVAGVIDGLLALIFFSWEIRSLKEFEWEISTARESAAVEADECEKK